MNILFAKETVGASVKEGTKPKVSVLTAPISITPNTANDGFTVDYGGGKVIGYALTGNVIKVNAVDVTASGAEVIGDKLRDEVFPNANSSAGGSGVAVKADDTAAFAAIQNGQSRDFEVNGVVSRYVKSSTGAKQIVTYPTYP